MGSYVYVYMYMCVCIYVSCLISRDWFVCMQLTVLVAYSPSILTSFSLPHKIPILFKHSCSSMKSCAPRKFSSIYNPGGCLLIGLKQWFSKFGPGIFGGGVWGDPGTLSRIHNIKIIFIFILDIVCLCYVLSHM